MALPTSSSNEPTHNDEDHEETAMLDANDAEEIIADEDTHMDSEPDDNGNDIEGGIEVEIHNDSSVYFDGHNDSVFSIAQHPVFPGRIILTGGGDDVGYIWEIPPPEESGGVKPYEAKLLQKLAGHTDSVAAAGFSKPDGRYVVTADLDGRVRSWRQKIRPSAGGVPYKPGVGDWEFVSEVQEVEEVNWIDFHPNKPVFAIGAGDGSVWIYTLEYGDGELQVQQALYNHMGSCTAGCWTPEGSYLCTVSEDGSFYVWDGASGKAVVSLTSSDSRFEVEGGLVSVAVNWDSSIAVVGGASGACKVVGLPRPTHPPTTSTGARRSRGAASATGASSQAGQILATLSAHTASVESLTFSRPLPLLASSSVDGSIVIYDTSRSFAVRRAIPHAHPNSRVGNGTGEDGENTVVKVEFVDSTHPPTGVVLTSCGVDGTVKRWDGRSGQEVGCWKGHSDGVLGFVQKEGRVVSAGDDHVALVFDIPQNAVSNVHLVQGASGAGALGVTR